MPAPMLVPALAPSPNLLFSSGRYKAEKMLLDGWPTVGRNVPRTLVLPAAAPAVQGAGAILAAAAAAGAAGGGAAAAAAAGGNVLAAAAAAAAGAGGGAAAAVGGGGAGNAGAAAGGGRGADSWDPPAWPVIEKEGKDCTGATG